MRSMYKLVIMATLAASLSTSACSSEPASDVQGHPWIGQQAPRFSLEKYTEAGTGDVVSLNDLRGRFVVVHFATSW